MDTIQSITRKEVQDFIHNSITVAQGYQFNQYENVKKTHLYLNSKFYDTGNVSTDSPLIEGDEAEDDDRIFFNITTPRVKAVKRFFDIDVADVVLDEIDPQSEQALQLLNKDFDRFAEKHNLNKDFNEFATPYVEYGSLVIEVMENKKPEIIPLQNYFLDPRVKRSKDSRFNTIRYTLSPKSLRDMVKKGGWDSDAVEEIIKNAENGTTGGESYVDGGNPTVKSTTDIDVYKRYGWIAKGLLDDSDDTTEVFALTVVACDTDATKLGNKDTEKDQILFKGEWKKDLPIEDTHLVQTHGRWQGIGIPELLYTVQQRMNEVCNQKRISMEISALHLFQTADSTVLNNILTDLENGDVIQTKVQGSVAPIVNEERNLPAFESEIATYSTQGDKLTFANDLLSGGDIASSTPATNAVIQNNNQVLVHLQDRENFTNFVADQYIKRHVVPNLIKEMSDEHYLRVVSDPEDLLQLDEKMVALNFWRVVKERAIKYGKVIDILQKEDLMSEIRMKLKNGGTNRYVKVVQDYYKNKIGDIQVIIGNEKKDMAKSASNTMQFSQVLSQFDLNDPVQRMFVTSYGREIGLDTARLELAFAKREAMQQQQQEQPPQGGGKPVAPREQPKEDPALAEVL